MLQQKFRLIHQYFYKFTIYIFVHYIFLPICSASSTYEVKEKINYIKIYHGDVIKLFSHRIRQLCLECFWQYQRYC